MCASATGEINHSCAPGVCQCPCVNGVAPAFVPTGAPQMTGPGEDDDRNPIPATFLA